MAQDVFIQINGIDGESLDASHQDEIDVIGWRWKVSQQAKMMSGSGGGAGKATVSDLEFTHQLDRASPNLPSALARRVTKLCASRSRR